VDTLRVIDDLPLFFLPGVDDLRPPHPARFGFEAHAPTRCFTSCRAKSHGRFR
jgi:hypothetical protein